MSDRDSSLGRAIRSNMVGMFVAQLPAAALLVWTWVGGLAHQEDLDVLQATVDELIKTQAADRASCSDESGELIPDIEELRTLSVGQLEWLVGWHAAERVPKWRREKAAKAARREFRARIAAGEEALVVALKLLPQR